jgi:hypothetical protein
VIIRNSARCVHCGVEIESTHRHDFRTHFCTTRPAQRRKWIEVDDKYVLVDVPGETTWNFAVDGGKAYIRRVGEGFTDTSEYTEQEDV